MTFTVPTCACCGHKQGEHKSGRSSFPHPMVYGICLVEGCSCREFSDVDAQIDAASRAATTPWPPEAA